jgi:hypothetical protein
VVGQRASSAGARELVSRAQGSSQFYVFMIYLWGYLARSCLGVRTARCVVAPVGAPLEQRRSRAWESLDLTRMHGSDTPMCVWQHPCLAHIYMAWMGDGRDPAADPTPSLQSGGRTPLPRHQAPVVTRANPFPRRSPPGLGGWMKDGAQRQTHEP